MPIDTHMISHMLLASVDIFQSKGLYRTNQFWTKFVYHSY